MLDNTIHLGDILTVVVILLTVYGMHVSARKNVEDLHRANIERFAKLEHRIGIVFRWFERNIIGGSGGSNDPKDS